MSVYYCVCTSLCVISRERLPRVRCSWNGPHAGPLPTHEGLLNALRQLDAAVMTDPDQLQDSLPLPVSTELLNLLDSFSRHTLAIFDDLSAPQHVTTAAAAPAAAPTRPTKDGALPDHGNEQAMPFAASLRSLNALSDLDERLAALMQKARKHEANQRRIEALEEEMVRYESQWRAEIIALEADRERLGRLVAEGRKDRERIDKAAQGGFPYRTDDCIARAGQYADGC